MQSSLIHQQSWYRSNKYCQQTIDYHSRSIRAVAIPIFLSSAAYHYLLASIFGSPVDWVIQKIKLIFSQITYFNMLIDFKVTPKEFLTLSKEICGYSQGAHSKIEWLHQKFKTVFGITAEICAKIFTRIKLLSSHHQNIGDVQPIYLLWALHFMRAYLKKLEILCTTLKVGCHKVVMK